MLCDLDRRDDEPEEDADPGHGVREEEKQRDTGERSRPTPLFTLQPTTSPVSISTIRMPVL